MQLELKDIVIQYKADSPVLADVNLVLNAGDFVVIHGDSGSGKSSLFRVMTTLQSPHSGDIEIDGRSISELYIPGVRRDIGYVQQVPVMIAGSVLDNLRFPFQFRASRRIPCPTCEDFRRSLDEFRLNDVCFEDDATKLSIGQQQRLALIRNISVDRRVLLCDEPVSALDIDSRKVVESKLQQINRDQGTTVVLVTHTGFASNESRVRSYRLTGHTLAGGE